MANEMITAGPWAGFEVIHRYTRAQAIADGVLVDVTAKARTCGFTVPVATLTATSKYSTRGQVKILHASNALS